MQELISYFMKQGMNQEEAARMALDVLNGRSHAKVPANLLGMAKNDALGNARFNDDLGNMDDPAVLYRMAQAGPSAQAQKTMAPIRNIAASAGRFLPNLAGQAQPQDAFPVADLFKGPATAINYLRALGGSMAPGGDTGPGPDYPRLRYDEGDRGSRVLVDRDRLPVMVR